MKSNPGGQLSPVEIVGRERLIATIWRILERQSLRLIAERRIGKTSIINKMRHSPPEEVTLFARDVEFVRSPIEFVDLLIRDLTAHIGGVQRAGRRVRSLLESLGGAEVGSVKLPQLAAPHWKELFIKGIEDLMDAVPGRVVFIFDEFPWMIQRIAENDGPDVAMEVLDVLRALRSDQPRLRMIYTGSIGLHNVLESLRRSGYGNDPTNDMNIVDVPALDPDDAWSLAVELLDGEGIAAEPDRLAVGKAIAAAVDGRPFFIHHVADQLVRHGGTVTERTVEETVEHFLRDAQDPWHLQHYRERIDHYYAEQDRPLALALLDVLAQAQDPLSLPDLIGVVGTLIVSNDEEQIRRIVTALARDHYIVQESGGGYRFRYPIIARSWRYQRGLVS